MHDQKGRALTLAYIIQQTIFFSTDRNEGKSGNQFLEAFF